MRALIDIISYYWKAVAAFIAPAVVLLAAPMTQGMAPTPEDYYKALAAALLTAFAVERADNRPRAGDALVDPTGVVGAEDEDVEYADDYVTGIEPDTTGGDHRLGKPIEPIEAIED